MAFCIHCGTELQDGELFCPKCGEKVISSSEETVSEKASRVGPDYADLVKKAKRKDQEAFGKLYEDTYQAVYYTAKGILHDDDTTMDVIQDAYVKAWQKLDQLDDPSRFSYWIKRIAANGAKDYLKKKKEDLFSSYEDDEGYVHLDMEDDRLDHQPEAQLDKGETRRLVEEILYDLPDEQRICTMMYYFDEMKVREIADDLAVSENTVKSRLNYAKKKIKEAVLDLEKKGTKLYGLSPIPFFIWLLREGASEAPVKPFAEIWQVLTGLQAQTTSSISAEAASKLTKTSAAKATADKSTMVAQKAATAGAKKGLSHFILHSSMAAKVATVVVTGALIGGVATGIVKHNQAKNNQPVATEQTTQEIKKPETPSKQKEENKKKQKGLTNQIAAAAYLDKIKEYEGKYGKCELISGESWNEVGFPVTYVKGCVFAELVDIDKNGIDELIIAYGGEDLHSYAAQDWQVLSSGTPIMDKAILKAYTVEVWTATDNNLEKTYEGQPYVIYNGEGNPMMTVAAKYADDGLYLIQGFGEMGEEKMTISIVNQGRAEVVYAMQSSFTTSGDAEYTINQERVAFEAFNSLATQWYPGNAPGITNYAIVTVEGDNLFGDVNQTQSTVQKTIEQLESIKNQ